MAVLRTWQRTYGQFEPTGTTPLIQPNNNTGSVEPLGAASVTSLRLRTDFELFCLCVGTGSANINLEVFYQVLVVVGSIEYVKASQPHSQTPLTDADPGPVTGSLGNWGQWEYLYPTIDFVDTLTPQTALITWRPKNGTIDTQFRREVTGNNGIDLWMPWEIQDGTGLLNTTTGGVSYNIGARFSQAWLTETKS